MTQRRVSHDRGRGETKTGRSSCRYPSSHWIKTPALPPREPLRDQCCRSRCSLKYLPLTIFIFCDCCNEKGDLEERKEGRKGKEMKRRRRRTRTERAIDGQCQTGVHHKKTIKSTMCVLLFPVSSLSFSLSFSLSLSSTQNFQRRS